MRKFLVGVAITVAATAMAAPAFAGEVTGGPNPKPTNGPLHANSICVFSGQNDDPTAPITNDMNLAPNGPGGRTQNYGQDVRNGLISPSILNPGHGTCAGGSNPARGIG